MSLDFRAVAAASGNAGPAALGAPYSGAAATVAGGVEVALDRTVLKQALRDDPEFFIAFFMAEALTHAVPFFHIEIFTEMTHADVDRLVMAVPRAHAKTTLAKLTCVWYLLFSHYRFVLYVSGSHELVVPYVNDIASFFETPNFIAVFGQVQWLKRQDGQGVYKFRIPSLGNKTCILRGLGAGQRVRGVNVDNERPQLVVADDIEDDENVKNPIMHMAMLDWWMGAFNKCLNQFDNKIIVAGNLLSKNSVLYKLLVNPKYRSFLYGCIKKDGTPLWPELWPIEKLRLDFLDYQQMGKVARWFAEMMNQPIAEGGNLIMGEYICYRPERSPGEPVYGFITIDPAMSKETWADRAVVMAHGWIEDESRWQVLEYEYFHGIDPIDMFWTAINLALKWRFRYIGVEAVAMQTILRYMYQHLLLLNQLQGRYEFVDVPTGNRGKTERGATFAAMVSTKGNRHAEYAITEGDFMLTQQLLNFEPMKRDNDDDVLDCAAMGPKMINLFLPQIMSETFEDFQHAAMTCVQHSEV